MVQVSYPGVYVVEVPSGVHTITGVSTSIGAFFGRATKGPMDKAVRCLSFADYERTFGAPHAKSQLAQSVRMFFANGGTECYVVRLAKGAQAAATTLKSLAGTNVLNISAKSKGRLGNGIQLEVNYDTPQPDETFNLVVIQMDGEREASRETHIGLSMDPGSTRFAPAFVSRSSELVNLALHPDVAAGGATDLTDINNSFAGFSQTRAFKTAPIADFRAEVQALFAQTSFMIELNVDDTQWVAIDLSQVFAAGGLPNAWQPQDLATRLRDLINPQLAAAGLPQRVAGAVSASGSFAAVRIVSDTPAASGGPRSVRVRRSPQNDIAGKLMLGLDQGGIEPVRFSNFRPEPTASLFADLNDLVELAGKAQAAITSISISGGQAIQATIPATSVPQGGTAPPAHYADEWLIDSSGGFDGVRQKLRLLAAAVNDARQGWQAEVWGYHFAIAGRGGTPNAAPSAIVSAGDAFLGGANMTLNVRRYPLGAAAAGLFQTAGAAGDDGTAPTSAEYLGNETVQTGFHALDPVDLFNLMVLPGDEEVDRTDLWAPASTYCEQRRAFLVVDPPDNWTTSTAPPRPAIVQDEALLNTFRSSIVKRNAAVFYPNVVYREGGVNKKIGPSGMLAGLMARTDSTRGVWKAPAGLDAGLRNISDLEINLTDKENGVLNKNGINALRRFPSGLVCWGARTLDGDDDFPSEWKYVPIRRFALFLEESLFRGTKWVVFEPNDEPLWAQIRKNLRAFMMGLFRQGAFQGSSPDQAFYVKCDGETTTANDRNLGIVNIEVGFAPLKPAEFVVIRIQQMAEQAE
ncbi:MAG TPA: phage tail sheath subtilisin-like domain-containing protein [Dehalococcoidia bacterium]